MHCSRQQQKMSNPPICYHTPEFIMKEETGYEDIVTESVETPLCTNHLSL